MKYYMLKYLFLSLLLSLFSACGVESFEPVISLTPPLDLSLSNTNPGEIEIYFRGYNTEDYFSGYNIYIATSGEDLNQNRGFKAYRSDGSSSTNLPTFDAGNVSSETAYSYIINRTTFPTNYALTTGILMISNRYYIYIKAYSVRYNLESNPCSFTNLFYLQ